MTNTPFYWSILVVVVLISAFSAGDMNKSLRESKPEVKPYSWGYFTGLMGALSWGLIGILQFIIASQEYGGKSETAALFGVFCLIGIVPNIFIIKRNKWGWVIGIFLQLNPILWIINGIYLKNRWGELSGADIERLQSRLNQTSLIYRASIAAAGFWALAVASFIFTFEPYGRYISDADWWQIIKIIVVPPVVTLIGYLLYSKILKNP